MEGLTSAAEQFGEKLDIRRSAPEGGDSAEFAVSLKRYPDTKLSFSENSQALDGKETLIAAVNRCATQN